MLRTVSGCRYASRDSGGQIVGLASCDCESAACLAVLRSTIDSSSGHELMILEKCFVCMLRAASAFSCQDTGPRDQRQAAVELTSSLSMQSTSQDVHEKLSMSPAEDRATVSETLLALWANLRRRSGSSTSKPEERETQPC